MNNPMAIAVPMLFLFRGVFIKLDKPSEDHADYGTDSSDYLDSNRYEYHAEHHRHHNSWEHFIFCGLMF